jgi:dienelactone hydrolase
MKNTPGRMQRFLFKTALPALAFLDAAPIRADDPATAAGYPADVKIVRYPVPEDGSEQPTLFWSPRLGPGQTAPLLVALHTWSGNYLQAGGEVKYAEWCQQNGWIFLHPDFRGPNRTPAALGSDLMIADIRAAVAWAKENAPVDESRIYAIGVSGGGHATQLLAGRMPGVWAGISSWCGIADIAAWHAETTAAGRLNYAGHIVGAIGGEPDASETTMAEAAHRSPLTWLGNADSVPLDLNHGITDGRSGSVPFTHSLRAGGFDHGLVCGSIVPAARSDTSRRPLWHPSAAFPKGPRQHPCDDLRGRTRDPPRSRPELARRAAKGRTGGLVAPENGVARIDRGRSRERKMTLTLRQDPFDSCAPPSFIAACALSPSSPPRSSSGRNRSF